MPLLLSWCEHDRTVHHSDNTLTTPPLPKPQLAAREDVASNCTVGFSILCWHVLRPPTPPRHGVNYQIVIAKLHRCNISATGARPASHGRTEALPQPGRISPTYTSVRGSAR